MPGVSVTLIPVSRFLAWRRCWLRARLSSSSSCRSHDNDSVASRMSVIKKEMDGLYLGEHLRRARGPRPRHGVPPPRQPNTGPTFKPAGHDDEPLLILSR